MDWIQDIIKHTLENYNGRKIVLWGKYGVSDKIKDILQNEYNIRNICYIDSNELLVDNQEVFSTDLIMRDQGCIYVVIPLAVHNSIKKILREGGYKPEFDYYYYSDCAVKVTQTYYEDAHGNKFIGKRDGVKFCFSGWNSMITIGQNVIFDKKMQLYMHNEDVFELGENSDISSCIIDFENGGKLYVGNNVVLENCNISVRNKAELIVKEGVWTETYTNSFQRILVRPYGKVVIGKGTSISHSFNIICPQNTEIVIGEDCLISWNLTVLSNDGHTIFDMKKKKPVNIIAENEKRKVEIGNHVWIGANCIILYDTYIGEGSIVGAGSLVKGKYPNNCMLVGQVAKVIKQDIAWCNNEGEEDASACGEFANLTEEI